MKKCLEKPWHLTLPQKINNKLIFINRKDNAFFNSCNALIQSHIYYTCSTWYPITKLKLNSKYSKQVHPF